MRTFRHILIALFAAAGVCLSTANCASGDQGMSRSEPSADTLALVEGLRFYREGDYASAHEKLRESALSENSYIRAESFLYLNALEMERGNYDAARPWLENYHSETIFMLRRAAEAERRMSGEMSRLERRHKLFVGGMICLGLAILGAVAVFVARRSSRRPGADGSGVADGGGYSGYASADGSGGSGNPNDGSGASIEEVDISEWRRFLIDAEIFKQTAIWAEIEALAGQPKGRSARVLSLARQEVLDGELAGRFEAFAARLAGNFPTLTAGDVKLCCLSLLPLSSFGRALCFGSTETGIVKQRKHTIKKKMDGDAQSRAVFGFIFEAGTR